MTRHERDDRLQGGGDPDTTGDIPGETRRAARRLVEQIPRSLEGQMALRGREVLEPDHGPDVEPPWRYAGPWND